MWNPLKILFGRRCMKDHVCYDYRNVVSESIPDITVLKNTTRSAIVNRILNLSDGIDSDCATLDGYLRMSCSLFIVSCMYRDGNAAKRAAELNMEIWRQINERLQNETSPYISDKKVRREGDKDGSSDKVHIRRGRGSDSELRKGGGDGGQVVLVVRMGKDGISCGKERRDSGEDSECISGREGLSYVKTAEDPNQTVFPFAEGIGENGTGEGGEDSGSVDERAGD